MKKLLLFISLFPLLLAAQTKTIIIPPSKDTVRVTYTATTTVSHSIDYLPTGPGNKPPIASAGNDVSVTLPTNTVTLSAVASSDADGTITNYSWSKVSGGTAILNQANTALNASGLVQGTYVFRITVTDNGGLTDIDDVNVVVLPAVSNPDPPTPGYTLTYQNGFDKSSDINSNQLGRGSISTSVFKSGTGSFRAEVRVGDPSISSGFRSEQQYNTAAQNPKTGAVEYDVLYESWQTTAWGGSSIQWHPNNSGSALLFLETAQGNFNTYQYIQKYKNTSTKIVPNKWYRMRWELNWSTGSDGYARLFIDGVKFWEYNGRTQDQDGQPYFKLGVNFFSSSTDQRKSVRGGVVYYDNLAVYKKN